LEEVLHFKKAFLPLILTLCSSALFADQVVLKNGDRLTGTIEKSSDKELVIKTEFTGEVTVQWPAIQEIKSDQPLHVGLKNGQTVVGPVSTAEGKLEVSTKTNGNVEVPKETVVVIRSGAEQLAWEKAQHPGLLEGWNGGLNVGFGLTGGNSETKNLALAFTGVRTGLHDKLSMYAGSVYASSATSTPNLTANNNKGGLRYDRDITPRLFAFVNADFFTDALQDLNIRTVGGFGLGFHAIKNDNTTLDILGGVNYTHENYTEEPPVAPPPHVVHNFAAGTFGDVLMHKLTKSTVITQDAYFFPDFNKAGEYRTTFDLGTVTKISKWLGWQNSFGNVYVTNPPAGKKRDDVVFTTGLNVTFAH
jgi:putative salt-induced outer membrane protein YdiY